MAPSCILEYLFIAQILVFVVFYKLRSGPSNHRTRLLQKLRDFNSWSKLPRAVVTWTSKVFSKNMGNLAHLKFANSFGYNVLSLFRLLLGKLKGCWKKIYR